MPVSSPSSLVDQPGIRPLLSAVRPRRQVILAFGAVAALAACGKKGELELPPQTEPSALPDDPRPREVR